MNRRGFLKGMAGILASGVAPYVCTTAGVLMPVKAIALPWRTVPFFGPSGGYWVGQGNPALYIPAAPAIDVIEYKYWVRL